MRNVAIVLFFAVIATSVCMVSAMPQIVVDNGKTGMSAWSSDMEEASPAPTPAPASTPASKDSDAEPEKPGLKESLGDLKDATKNVASNVGEKVKSTASDVGEKISDTASDVGEKVSDTASEVADRVDKAADALAGNTGVTLRPQGVLSMLGALSVSVAFGWFAH
jgi:gas vesicle protein